MSNDNPYSEAAFKTLKYAPDFPETFGSLADARAFCEEFFAYYNHEHRHSGIGLHTPASVHYGTAARVRAERQATLDAAYAPNPERFSHRRPAPPKLPDRGLDQPALTRSAHTERLTDPLSHPPCAADGARSGGPAAHRLIGELGPRGLRVGLRVVPAAALGGGSVSRPGVVGTQGCSPSGCSAKL